MWAAPDAIPARSGDAPGMPAPRPTSTLFPSVLCGTDNSASGVAARRQARWLAGSNGLVELAPQRELTDLGSRALAERCLGHDLLVLGSEGSARTLIACAPVPVLLARWCPVDRDVTDEILVAVGDHAGAERAAQLAAQLAVRRGGSVSVVPAPGRSHDLSRAIAATQRIVLCTAGMTPRLLSEVARPEVAIARAAAQIGASLLVLGTGDDAWSAAEAADIARHTGCSLLAVPGLTARSARESSRSRRTDTPRRTGRSPYRSRGRSRTRTGRARRA
jgi:nucleotide-binding universal stress UspA family protein